MVKKVTVLPYNVLILCKQSACLETPGAEHGNPATSRPRDLIFFPCGSAGKESSRSAGDLGSIPGLGRSPGEGKGYPLQYSGPETPHGQRSLMGYSLWGCKETDMTEQLSIAHPNICLALCFTSRKQISLSK